MSTQTVAQEYRFLVGGEWQTSSQAVEIRSPYNGEVVGITYQASPEQVEQAVQGAAKAFQHTRSLPTWRRAEILEKIVQALKTEQESIARRIALESGKPIRLARAEAARAVLTFTDALEEAKRIRGEWLPLDLDASSSGRFALVRRFPAGPV